MSEYYSECSSSEEFIEEYSDDCMECDSYESSDGKVLNEMVQSSSCKNDCNYMGNDKIDDDTGSVSSRSTLMSVLDDEFSMKSGMNNIYEHCNYCNSTIKCTPMNARAVYTDEELENIKDSEYYNEVTSELHFCDICCAKLFHDSLHPICVDYKSYNNALNNNGLDKITADIFKRIGHTPFGALPVYQAAIESEQMEGLNEQDILNNRVVFHNIYRKVIRNAINY